MMFYVNTNTISYLIYRAARDEYKHKTKFHHYDAGIPATEVLTMQRKIWTIIVRQKWGMEI